MLQCSRMERHMAIIKKNTKLMRKKKLTEFEALIGKINLTYNGPPYEYNVTVNGVKKVMSGFSEQHIRDQLGNKKSTRNAKVRKKKDV